MVSHMEQPTALDQEVSHLVVSAVECDGRPITEICTAAGIPRSTFYRNAHHGGTFSIRQLAALARVMGLSVSLDLTPNHII